MTAKNESVCPIFYSTGKCIQRSLNLQRQSGCLFRFFKNWGKGKSPESFGEKIIRSLMKSWPISNGNNTYSYLLVPYTMSQGIKNKNSDWITLILLNSMSHCFFYHQIAKSLISVCSFTKSFKNKTKSCLLHQKHSSCKILT